MAIVTLPEVKQQLNITSSVHDAELTFYIDAAERIIEEITGRSVTTRSYSEEREFDCAANRVFLWNRPLVSLTSVTSVLPGTAVYNVSDIHINYLDGELSVQYGNLFHGRLIFVYNAGTANVPANYQYAARLQVQFMWQSQRGSSGPPVAGGLGTPTMPGNTTKILGFTVPFGVLDALGSHPPVVA